MANLVPRGYDVHALPIPYISHGKSIAQRPLTDTGQASYDDSHLRFL